MSCVFCQGNKFIKFSAVGNGIKTVRTNLGFVFGCEIDEDEKTDCLFLENNKWLGADTSSGEYAPQFVEINFCPFCGKELLKNDP